MGDSAGNRQNFCTASSGNRTRAARVAGEHSTTEPTMLLTTAVGYYNMTVSTIMSKSDNKKTFAVGRIRTYARRAELISSQSP